MGWIENWNNVIYRVNERDEERKRIRNLQKGKKLTKEEKREIKRIERNRTIVKVFAHEYPETIERILSNGSIDLTNPDEIIKRLKEDRAGARKLEIIRKELNHTVFLQRLAAGVVLGITAINIGTTVLPEPNTKNVTIEEASEEPNSEDENPNSDYEIVIDEEAEVDKIRDKLNSLNDAGVGALYKRIYAELYKELNGEEIDVTSLKCISSYNNYVYVVTLKDGNQVAVLHGELPAETTKELEALGVDYRKNTDVKYTPCYTFHTGINEEVIDGTVGSYQIVPLDVLVSYCNGEIEELPASVADMIPDEIKEIFIKWMSGNTLPNDSKKIVAQYIVDNNLVEIVLEEEKEESENKSTTSSQTSPQTSSQETSSETAQTGKTFADWIRFDGDTTVSEGTEEREARRPSEDDGR